MLRFLLLFGLYTGSILAAKAQWSLTGSIITTGGYVEKISFLTPQLGYVLTSQDQIRKTSDGGSSWFNKYLPGQLTGSEVYFFNDLAFVNTSTAFAVGLDLTAAAYLILRTDNDGLDWTPFTYGNGLGSCNALDFPNASTGYVVGDYGVYFKTTNGGADWSVNNTPTSNNLIDVDFINAQNGWLLSVEAQLLITSNGGANFSVVNTPVPFLQVQMLSTQLGFASSGAGLYKTIDGGFSWTPTSTAPFLSGIGSFQMLNANLGYAISENTLAKTLDGGQHWLLQEFQGAIFPGDLASPVDLWMFDANNGITTTLSNNTNAGVIRAQLVQTSVGGGIAANFIATPSVFECPNQPQILNILPQFDGAPNQYNWLLDGTPFSNTANPPALNGPFSVGNHTIQLQVSKGNNTLQLNRDFAVLDAPYFGWVNLSINGLPCAGEPLTIQCTNWSDPDKMVALLQNGQLVDGPKLLDNPFGFNQFHVPSITDTSTFEMVVFTACGQIPASSITVPVRPLADLSLSVEVLGDTLLCTAGQVFPVKIALSDPNTLYNIYQNGIQANTFSQPGNGGDLIFNSSPFNSTTVLQVLATSSSGCPAYLTDSVIVKVEEPQARFAVSGINFPEGTPVSVQFEGSFVQEFEWNFGPSANPASFDALQPPPIQFSNTSAAVIQLIGRSPLGCLDTFVKQIGFYNPSQLTEYWAMEINAGRDNEKQVIVDKAQNVWCTAKIPGNNTVIPSKAGSETIQPVADLCLLQYDRFGVLKQHLAFGGQGNRNWSDIVTDAQNNLYAAISMAESPGNLEYTIFPSSNEKRKFVRNHFGSAIGKYNLLGELLWIVDVQTCSAAGSYVIDLEVDHSGNTLLLGETNFLGCNNIITLLGADSSLTTLNNAGTHFIAKISSDGQVLWVKNLLDAFGQPIQGTLHSFKIDTQNQLYISGEGNVLLSKYDQDANLLWSLGPLPSAPFAAVANSRNLALDPAGNAYIAGNFRLELHLPGQPPLIPSNPAFEPYHLFVAKINAAGQVLWAKMGESNISYAENTAVQWQDGAVWLGGFVIQQIQYEGNLIKGDAEWSAVVLKIEDQNGQLQEYMVQGKDNSNDPFNTYLTYGRSLALSDQNNIHWMGVNGYECSFDNTILAQQNWVFLAKFKGLTPVDIEEPVFDKSLLEASIHPNPSRQTAQLTLVLQNPVQLSATATNLLGQTIRLWDARSFEAGTQIIPLNPEVFSLNPGLWYLQFMDNKGNRKTLTWLVY
jgi:photosystem II stability/assembly factor-like uncharacterized protein